jgi:hypothetical protein
MGGLTQQDVAALGGYQGPPPASFSSSDILSAGNPNQPAPPAPAGQWQSVPQTNQYGRVTPDLPLEQQQQPDPFQPILQPLYAKLKQLTPTNPQPISGGVRGFLQNFLTGGGEAMMHHVGLLTPDEQRQNLTQQIAAIEGRREAWMNTQSEIEARKQMLASAQQAQQFQQQMQPLQLQHEQLLNQQSQFALDQEQKNVPTVQPVMDAETAKVAGIPDRFVGQPFSEADWRIVDQRLTAKGLQRFDTGVDDPVGNNAAKGEWLIDRFGNPFKQISKTSTSGRATALMKQQIAAAKTDPDIETAAQALTNPRNLTALKDIASMRGDQRLRIFARAREIDPNFDPGMVNERVKFLQSYEDPKGRAAINRQAINNILQHAGDLSDVNQEYRRANVKVINTPLNEIARQFGTDTYTRFALTNSVLKDELSLYFAGGYAPNVDQQKMWNKIQSDEATPSATEAFAKEVVHLGLRRATTFNSQFQKVMGYNDPNMVIPEAKNAADKLGLGAEVAQFGSGGQYGQGQPSQPVGGHPLDKFWRK